MITKDLQVAVDTLKSGGLVAIPTETVYGLAAVFDDVNAIKSVFTAKNRPFFDPLIVHIGQRELLKELAVALTTVEEHLLNVFWPGPLTIIKKKLPAVSDLITSGQDSVAVRMPAHPLALELLQKLGRPVVAPSANQFGKTSPTTAEHVAGEFSDELVILDGGECEIGIESTIICCSGTEIQILRPGGISRSDLEKELTKFSGVNITRSQSNAAPGQLSHHYQPSKSLIVFREAEDLEAALQRENVKLQDCFKLELPEDAKVAARKLYADLRAGDASNYSALILKWDHPFDGQWEGIWDRVQRAAKVITFR